VTGKMQKFLMRAAMETELKESIQAV
jgi:hypothetical protein